MFDLRSRAGIVGIATGAALLAVPVVAAGQVPVVDQVAGRVAETAERLAPAPAPPVDTAPAAKPAPLPAAAVGPSAPAPGPAPTPARSRATPTPPASAPAPRAAAAPSAASETSSPSPAPKGNASDAQEDGATARAATGEAASDAQSDSADGQTDGSTDVEIAAADSGNEGSPASLPFTGLQLALIAVAGVATLTGGALLRRAA